MPSAAGAKVMWCSLLCGETQCREMHASAHWEGLFGVIKSGRSTARGGETEIDPCSCLSCFGS